MSKDELLLTPLQSVSPSLAAVLEACPLRAGLSQAPGAGAYVLAHPKAWLGTAFHAVLEAAASSPTALGEDEVVRIWDDAVEREVRRALHHPLNCRFAEPSRWPGYYRIREAALLRASQVAAGTSRRESNGGGGAGQGARGPILESRLVSGDGRVVGKPDSIQGRDVIDHKTGELYSDPNARTIKEDYVRQLRLYGFLVHETFGWWPDRGVLVGLSGDEAGIDLTPVECQEAATAALDSLDAYNETLLSTADPLELADPSASACQWCEFKNCCGAFWRDVEEECAEELGSGAVMGDLLAAPEATHGGRAVSLRLQVVAGTSPVGELSISRLDPKMHSVLARVGEGDTVRVSGLWQRRDGSLAPSDRTVLTRVSEAPEIVIRSSRGERPHDGS